MHLLTLEPQDVTCIYKYIYIYNYYIYIYVCVSCSWQRGGIQPLSFHSLTKVRQGAERSDKFHDMPQVSPSLFFSNITG